LTGLGLRHQAIAYPPAREVMEFDGKRYLLERAIKGDVAFVRAWKCDPAGNVVFRYAAQNFGAAMARSARCTIIEESLASSLSHASCMPR
jgi:3-oxoacid CoA-transferase